jgi:SPP1 family predicted phage head-tail adaptor
MIDAGSMDRRITIQGVSLADDGYGGQVETWSTVAEVWAQFLPGGGNEKFASAQVYAETQARFRIRWRSGLSPKNRITFDGKTWDVLAVDEVGRKEGLELKVKARADG